MNISRTTLIVGLALAALVGILIFSGAGWYRTQTQFGSIAEVETERPCGPGEAGCGKLPIPSEVRVDNNVDQSINNGAMNVDNPLPDARTFRNEEIGFEFKYPTKPDRYGAFLEPIREEFGEPWSFGLIFCSVYPESDGSCGMGRGSKPDFGIQQFTEQNRSTELLMPDDEGFVLNSRPLSVSSVTVDGYEGRLLTFSYSYGVESGIFREINLLVEDKLFVFGIIDDGDANTALFDSILSTLRFF